MIKTFWQSLNMLKIIRFKNVNKKPNFKHKLVIRLFIIFMDYLYHSGTINNVSISNTLRTINKKIVKKILIPLM